MLVRPHILFLDQAQVIVSDGKTLPPSVRTRAHERVTNRIQRQLHASPRPFNLLTGVDINGDRHSTTDRPIYSGRNTGIGPDFWTVDLRLARAIRLDSESRILELTAEVFNLFNNLNYGSVNNTVGPKFKGPFHVHADPGVGPSGPLGYTSAAEARRFQLGLRFSF